VSGALAYGLEPDLDAETFRGVLVESGLEPWRPDEDLGMPRVPHRPGAVTGQGSSAANTSSTACAAAMRAGIGNARLASMTRPMRLAGTKAT
jgi:hypothetical protein